MYSWLLIGHLIMVTEVSWMQFGVNRTRDFKIERTENDDYGINWTPRCITALLAYNKCKPLPAIIQRL